MFIMLLAVIGTSIGVFLWFNRKLTIIEDELWGKKRLEAEKTARETTMAKTSKETTEE